MPEKNGGVDDWRSAPHYDYLELTLEIQFGKPCRFPVICLYFCMAWPIVREYIWETCFEGNELFVGYADSYPGREGGSAVVFHLMIDKDVWSHMPSNQRRAALDECRKLVEDRLKAVDLQGTLEVMLVTR